MLAAGHKGRALMGGLPDAGVQRGCQDGVQVQDGAQGQGEVQDRSFEAEHATTRPGWFWRPIMSASRSDGISAESHFVMNEFLPKGYPLK